MFTGSTSQTPTSIGVDDQVLFLSLNEKASKTIGGKASLQPKRTPMSNEEIEAILVTYSYLVIALVFSSNAMCFKHSIWTFLVARNESNRHEIQTLSLKRNPSCLVGKHESLVCVLESRLRFIIVCSSMEYGVDTFSLSIT